MSDAADKVNSARVHAGLKKHLGPVLRRQVFEPISKTSCAFARPTDDDNFLVVYVQIDKSGWREWHGSKFTCQWPFTLLKATDVTAYFMAGWCSCTTAQGPHVAHRRVAGGRPARDWAERSAAYARCVKHRRSVRDLDDWVLGRDWPTWSWLPAMTTLQALGVIILGLVVAGFIPRISLGGGFGLNPGNGLVALAFAVAAFSPKRAGKRQPPQDDGD
ncbi:MAG: hypothetical protein JWN55_115 [Frankiales bacterium]|nr:hypothetical protein [Frankiales bacterium]